MEGKVSPRACDRRISREDLEFTWFHGKVSREMAETRLLSNDRNCDEGTFLVRESNSSSGDYVLSLVNSGKVVHFQIRQMGDDAFYAIDEGPVIHGLDTLIQYYQEDDHGLPFKLGRMCIGMPPPHDTRKHGRTNLLHRAAKEGDLRILQEVINSGYHSLEAKNQDGQTALHLAVIHGHVSVAKFLLQVGAPCNVRDSVGLTPLHYACRINQAELVSQLMDHGANPQVRSSRNNEVALQEAAKVGAHPCIEALLKGGAPIRPRTLDSLTPSDIAREEGHLDCLRLLEEWDSGKVSTQRGDWLHLHKDRQHAEECLLGQGQDGDFLLRRSTRKRISYVLCLLAGGHVYHFEIQRQGRFYYIDDGPLMESLERLVEHYMRWPDGLPLLLNTPIPPSKDEAPAAIPSPPPLPQLNSPKNRKWRPATNGEQESVDASLIHVSGNGDTWRTLPRVGYVASENLVLGETLGEGEFGSVRKAIWSTPDGRKVEVAVKLPHEERKHIQDEFIQEAKLMMSLNHPYIVRLVGISTHPRLMLVQELVSMGSLLDILHTQAKAVKSHYHFKLWAAQVIRGMMYLEEKRYVHRDLACRNLLLASWDHVKVGDFGHSRALGTNKDYYRAQRGGRWPVKWYAPEAVNFSHFSLKSDIWSFGVTLWEIYTFGEHPYGELRGSQVLELVERGERLKKPDLCPQFIYDLMLRCWTYEAEERPSFAQLNLLFSEDTEYANVSS